MSRYKTFVATGIAPDGRLYAGDLNGMQDLATPLSDFTTTLDVGTLRIGDPSLQLLKYGAGEFRMSGHLRVDGILRPGGGTAPGQFTTAQRDAIPVGRRPFGLIIFNLTTSRYEYNSGTDASPNWISLGTGGAPGSHAGSHLPGGSDPINFNSVNLSGTRAAKPSASAANNGLFYFETDWNQLWRSNGSVWQRASMVARSIDPSELATLSPADGDEIAVNYGNGIRWHFRYLASGGSFKWEFMGGAPGFVQDDFVGTITNQTYQDIGGPYITAPFAGDYVIEYGFRMRSSNPWEDTVFIMSPQIGATAPNESFACFNYLEWGQADSPSVSISTRRDGLSANSVVGARYRMYKHDSSGNPNPAPADVWAAWIKLIPIRIG